jgi:serine/threonine protein kinase
MDITGTVHSGKDNDWFKDFIVIALSVTASAFIICVILVGAFIVKRLKQRDGYDIIADPPHENSLTSSKIRAKYAGLFQIRGTEIKLGPRIGKGSYGEVYKAEWRGITVAIKKLPVVLLENKEFLRDFNKEASIMSSLRHPHVLQFLGSCMIDGDICIITEYMAKGSVHTLLHDETFSITYELIKRFSIDTAQGMLYLHQSNPPVIHRDLKSHNLLCDDSFKVKISDFGLSKVIDHVHNTHMTSCGTAAWAAPEVLKQANYTSKADVFSFGICLWEFWTRKDPYEGMPTFQIVFAVGDEGLRPTIPTSCPQDYSRLMMDCWQVDPQRRPTYSEIIKRLKELR